MAVIEYDFSSFGTHLKAFRKRRHLTQQQLAHLIESIGVRPPGGNEEVSLWTAPVRYASGAGFGS